MMENTININKKFLEENKILKYKDVFVFLEKLRRSGDTNMFGSLPYLENEFSEINNGILNNLLYFYMQNYKDIYLI